MAAAINTERDKTITISVLNGGSLSQVAEAFGISRARVGQVTRVTCRKAWPKLYGTIDGSLWKGHWDGIKPGPHPRFVWKRGDPFKTEYLREWKDQLIPLIERL